ncbi:hypothetical protein [Rubritalea tangerina]
MRFFDSLWTECLFRASFGLIGEEIATQSNLFAREEVSRLV